MTVQWGQNETYNCAMSCPLFRLCITRTVPLLPTAMVQICLNLWSSMVSSSNGRISSTVLASVEVKNDNENENEKDRINAKTQTDKSYHVKRRWMDTTYNFITVVSVRHSSKCLPLLMIHVHVTGLLWYRLLRPCFSSDQSSWRAVFVRWVIVNCFVSKDRRSDSAFNADSLPKIASKVL